MTEIESFKTYISSTAGKDLYIPIAVKRLKNEVKIFVYRYKDFTKKWVLSGILYDNEDEFNTNMVEYNGEIDYYGLFKCVFKYGNDTEYGDKI